MDILERNTNMIVGSLISKLNINLENSNDWSIKWWTEMLWKCYHNLLILVKLSSIKEFLLMLNPKLKFENKKWLNQYGGGNVIEMIKISNFGEM